MSKAKTFQFKHEVKELSLLFEVSQLLDRSIDLRDVVGSVLEALSNHIGMSHGTLTLLNRETGKISISCAHGLSKSQQAKGIYNPGEGVTGTVIESGRAVVIPKVSEEPQFLNRTGVHNELHLKDISFICVPIKIGNEVIGALSVDRLTARDDSLKEEFRLLSIISSMIAQAVRLRQTANEIQQRLQEENIRLQNELRDRFRPTNIIGNSTPMQSVYDLISQVANSNTNVLIRGESGTGKELIAQHIHQKSKFKDGPFIVVNCPAIPENLVESELFGHSKGAFTGATDNRMGKFEAANNGTIFLDEIADLPLGIQSKLLRVLQERTIEVVGSNKVKKINTRVICASHKDLKDEIAHGRFRLDLYYRLAEFDLKVPSLANRREDIPILARQFAKEICLEESRPILEFSPQLLDFLKGYEWPGNIRELKSLVRKLVILSQPGKGVIDAVPPNLLLSFSSQQDKEELKTAAVPGGKPTLKELEKAAIMTAIEEEKYNLSAVAKRLGIGRTTLYRKLKTHKIPYLRQPQQGNSPDKIGDIIDLDAYRQMQQLFGDQDDFEMKLVLNKFLALNQDYLSMIRQAANQQKLDLLINYSHELLDSCRSFGAKGVVEACENLNKVDSDTRLDLLFKLIQDLEEQIQIFTQFMEKRLA